MSEVQEAMHNAKNALLYALRLAEDKKAPAALRQQLDRLTGRAEALEWKFAEQAKRK